MIVLLGLVLPAHAASPQALQADTPTGIGAAHEVPSEKLSAMQMASPIERNPLGELGQAAQGEQDDEPCPGHPNIHRNSEACREKMRGGGDGRGQRGSGAPARADWQVNEDSVLLPRHSDH